MVNSGECVTEILLKIAWRIEAVIASALADMRSIHGDLLPPDRSDPLAERTAIVPTEPLTLSRRMRKKMNVYAGTLIGIVLVLLLVPERYHLGACACMVLGSLLADDVLRSLVRSRP